MELGLLISTKESKNYCVVNRQKNSRQKSYYVEHRDLTKKEYEELEKQGRKSGNILDEYYSVIG